MKLTTILVPCLVMFLLGTLTQKAKSQILLTVNESNPDAVTITTTGATPLNPASSDIYDGIDLLGFFTSNQSSNEANLVLSSTLRTGNTSSTSGGPFLNQNYSDDVSTGGNGIPSQDPYLDLNLYGGSLSNNSPETFTLGYPAFTGSITLDLTGIGLTGTSGIVDAGSSGDGVTQIGTYEVVTSAPEPSSWTLLIGGGLLLLLLRGYRSRRRELR